MIGKGIEKGRENLSGFSGYQPLIRAYIGRGLRADLARLEENPEVTLLAENLRKYYEAEDDIIASAIADVRNIREAAA